MLSCVWEILFGFARTTKLVRRRCVSVSRRIFSFLFLDVCVQHPSSVCPRVLERKRRSVAPKSVKRATSQNKIKNSSNSHQVNPKRWKATTCVLRKKGCWFIHDACQDCIALILTRIIYYTKGVWLGWRKRCKSENWWHSICANNQMTEKILQQ